MIKYLLVAIAAAVPSTALALTAFPLFPDVDQSAWYANGVDDMSGVMTGYPDGTFRPDSYVNRAQLATILDRYAQSQKETTSLLYSLRAVVCLNQETMRANAEKQTTSGTGIYIFDSNSIIDIDSVLAQACPPGADRYQVTP
jgi:hypothetical protein